MLAFGIEQMGVGQSGRGRDIGGTGAADDLLRRRPVEGGERRAGQIVGVTEHRIGHGVEAVAQREMLGRSLRSARTNSARSAPMFSMW